MLLLEDRSLMKYVLQKENWWLPAESYMLIFFSFFCLPTLLLVQSLKNWMNWACLLYAYMDKHWKKVQLSEWKQLLYTSGNKWAWGWHYSDLQCRIGRHLKMFHVFSCRGGQRSSQQVPFLYWVLDLSREMGQIFRYFVKNHFRTFWVLAALTRGLKSLGSQALCKYLVPLQPNHLTTDNRRNSYSIILWWKSFFQCKFSWGRMALVILLVLLYFF